MSRPLVYFCIALCAGCLSSLMFYKNVIAGAVFTALFLFCILKNEERKFAALVIGFYLTGILSFNLYFNFNLKNDAVINVKENLGRVVVGECSGRRVILTGNVKKLKDGERVLVHGKFSPKVNYDRGELGAFQVKSFKVVNRGLLCKVSERKNWFHSLMAEKLGDERAALVMSLCFGETKYLERDEVENLKKNGVIHAVSVSGMHMSLVYGVLEKIAGFPVAICASALYLAFTGVKASTVRAFIMIVVLKMAGKVKKNYDSISALCLSAMILITAKPYYMFDAGFMLSYLATLGILVYYKKIQRLIYKLPDKLNESLSLTLSAQIFTYPYLAFTMGNFAPGFILGNLMLVPLYSIVVVTGNIAMLMTWFKPLFNVALLILRLTFTAYDGCMAVLEHMTPDMIDITYVEGLVFLATYFMYLLHEHGFKKVRHMPAMLAVSMILTSYKLMPEIHSFTGVNENGVVISSGFQRVLVCNYQVDKPQQVFQLKKQYGVNRVVTNPECSSKIKINEFLTLKVTDEHSETLKLEVRHKGHACGIIRMPDEKVGNENEHMACSNGLILGERIIATR